MGTPAYCDNEREAMRKEREAMKKPILWGCLFFWVSSLVANPIHLLKYSSDPNSLDKWKHCGLCHLSPTGGGERTEFGEAFKANK